MINSELRSKQETNTRLQFEGMKRRIEIMKKQRAIRHDGRTL